MLLLVLYVWYKYGIYDILALTNWGAHLTYFSFVLSYKATEDQLKYPDKVSGLKFLRWRTAVWMFEVSLILEIGITIVFWTMLYDPSDPFSWDSFENICIHSLPLIMLTIDFFMQRWVFRYNHLAIVFMIGIPYLFLNYYWTVTHSPIYPMLTWDDIESVIFVLSYIALTVLSFNILYLFTRINAQLKESRKINTINQSTVVLIPALFERRIV